MTSGSAAGKHDDVLLVQEFWDVPLSGVATFEGGLYAFQRVYDEEAQAWTQSSGFNLQPLSGTDLAQFNELHDIFAKWQAKYKLGTAGPHPLMPEAIGPEADRYKALHRAVETILHEETERTIRCTGTMSLAPGESRYKVLWQRT